MIGSLLLSVAVVAVEPRPVVGTIEAHPKSRSFVRFRPDAKPEYDLPTVEAPYERTDSESSLIYLGEYTIRHEDDPETPLTIDDVIGRRVRLRPPGATWAGTIEIIGSVVVDPRDAALVARGLGSPRYAIREAARDVLVRRGNAAIPALRDGLKSADLEVRERCRWCLDEIRTGVRE